jgi:hypothetical protein
VSKAIKELTEVFHGGIPEHFRLAVFLASQAFRQMSHDLGKLFCERLLGQLHGFFKSRRDAT